MEYLAIIVGASVCWYLGKLFVEILGEVIICRLHNSRNYRILAGKEQRINSKKSDGAKMQKIGF